MGVTFIEMLEISKLLSVAGLLVDLVGIIMLFHNERINLDARRAEDELPEGDPVKAFNDAVEGRLPEPKPTIDFVKESRHRKASLRNAPEKSRSRLLTAYFILGIGFVLQTFGVILN